MANKNKTNVSLLLRDIVSSSAGYPDVISLDCWGTIMTLRDDFWVKFANVFREIFSVESRITDDQLLAASRIVNKNIDAQSTRDTKDRDQVYRIMKTLQYLHLTFNHGQISRLVDRIDALISDDDYGVLLDDDIKSELVFLRQQGVRVVLSSNTGLISGRQTRALLKKTGIIEAFDNIFMSDEVGYSKPSKAFFKHVQNKMENAYGRKRVSYTHIGDDVTADYDGAVNSGWNAYLVPYRINFLSLSNNRVSAETYSRFKFGLTSAVMEIADMVFQMVVHEYPQLLTNPSLGFVFNYRHTLSASTLLAESVKASVDKERVRWGLSESSIVRISRTIDDLSSYSHQSVSARKKYEFSPLEFIGMDGLAENTPLLVVDDSFVSGSHTRLLRTLFAHRDVYFMYAKRLSDENDMTENSLNHFAVKTLQDLARLYEISGVRPTRKYYKLLLTSPLHEAYAFIEDLTRTDILMVQSDLKIMEDDLRGELAYAAKKILEHIDRVCV